MRNVELTVPVWVWILSLFAALGLLFRAFTVGLMVILGASNGPTTAMNAAVFWSVWWAAIPVVLLCIAVAIVQLIGGWKVMRSATTPTKWWAPTLAVTLLHIVLGVVTSKAAPFLACSAIDRAVGLSYAEHQPREAAVMYFLPGDGCINFLALGAKLVMLLILFVLLMVIRNRYKRV